MKTLSERLSEALKGPPKITKKALADACKIKPPSVSDWMSGRTKKIEGENLLAAARFLKVRPEWLASGKGEMRPNRNEIESDSEKLLLDNVSLSKRQIIQMILDADEDKITPEKIPLIGMTIDADIKNIPTLSTVTYALNHPDQTYNAKRKKEKKQRGK